MSRNPKDHPAGHAPFGDMEMGDGPTREPYTKRSTAHAPVPDRTRDPRVGPCDPTAYPSRSVSDAPRFTEELNRGVDLGTVTGEVGRPSAAHGSISYEERQRRARAGR
jgi:hypothetical protein